MGGHGGPGGYFNLVWEMMVKQLGTEKATPSDTLWVLFFLDLSSCRRHGLVQPPLGKSVQYLDYINVERAHHPSHVNLKKVNSVRHSQSLELHQLTCTDLKSHPTRFHRRLLLLLLPCSFFFSSSNTTDISISITPEQPGRLRHTFSIILKDKHLF